MPRMTLTAAPLSTLMRIHARTPEAWIGATLAAGAAWSLAVGRSSVPAGGPLLGAALVAGAAAQAAAGAVVAGSGAGRLPVAAGLERICWPVGGACLAAVVGRLGGGSGEWLMVAAAISAAAAATATVATACSRRGIGPTDATSSALVTAAAAGAAAGVCSGLLLALLLAIAAWLAAAGAAWWLSGPAGRAGEGFAWQAERSGQGERSTAAATLLAHGPARAALSTVAMLSSLAGMAAWFFLDPESGRLYPLLALAWFVCLVVPQATSLPANGRAGMLARSAAGADNAWQGPAARRARASAGVHALVLGWPAIVALCVYGTGGFIRWEPVVWPAATVAALAVAAGGVAALMTVAARFQVPPGTIRAVALSGAAAAGLSAFVGLA